jgi:hypothetical protein
MAVSYKIDTSGWVSVERMELRDLGKMPLCCHSKEEDGDVVKAADHEKYM